MTLPSSSVSHSSFASNPVTSQENYEERIVVSETPYHSYQLSLIDDVPGCVPGRTSVLSNINSPSYSQSRLYGGSPNPRNLDCNVSSYQTGVDAERRCADITSDDDGLEAHKEPVGVTEYAAEVDDAERRRIRPCFSQPFVTSFMATASGLNFSVAEGPEQNVSEERWVRRRAQRRAQWQAAAFNDSASSSTFFKPFDPLSAAGASPAASQFPELPGTSHQSELQSDGGFKWVSVRTDTNAKAFCQSSSPHSAHDSLIPSRRSPVRIDSDERLPLPGIPPLVISPMMMRDGTSATSCGPLGYEAFARSLNLNLTAPSSSASRRPLDSYHDDATGVELTTTQLRPPKSMLDSVSSLQARLKPVGTPFRSALKDSGRSHRLNDLQSPLFSKAEHWEPQRTRVFYDKKKPAMHETIRDEGSEIRRSRVEAPRCSLRSVFFWMLSIAFLCNFDHGVIPACLNDIAQGMRLSFIEQSLLGSFVYLGLIVGTVIGGAMLQRIRAKKLLLGSLALLAISVLALTLFNHLWILYLARFLSGLAQAIPTVYLPVWVDEFAPRGSTAQWISFTQLASIFGTVFGYFLGGAITRITPPNPDTASQHVSLPWKYVRKHAAHLWRAPFIVQAALVLPTFFALAIADSSFVSIKLAQEHRHRSMQKTGAHNANAPGSKELRRGGGRYSLATTETYFPFLLPTKSYTAQIKVLASQPLYVLTTLAMSNLYFIVTGMQFWVTQYLVDGLQNDKLTVISTTTFCFLTSPTLGVYVGGLICDLTGGYKKSKQREAMMLVTTFAGVASVFAAAAALVTHFTFFVVLIWLCLFSGAAIVPISIGLIMSSTPPPLRSISSALSQVITNILGWFAGPLLPGTVMDILTACGFEAPQPLLWGFRFILASSLGGFLCFLIALLIT